MLVLSRKPKQTIVIDENITITILNIRGNTIRLGIEAPKTTSVRRGEVPPLEKERPRGEDQS